MPLNLEILVACSENAFGVSAVDQDCFGVLVAMDADITVSLFHET